MKNILSILNDPPYGTGRSFKALRLALGAMLLSGIGLLILGEETHPRLNPADGSCAPI